MCFLGTKASCEDIGRSIIAVGHRTPVSELVTTIENLPNETVREVTEKYTSNKCLVVSAAGPIENLLDYVNLRSRMYWARV